MGLVLHAPLWKNGTDTAMNAYINSSNAFTLNDGGPFGRHTVFGSTVSTTYGRHNYKSTFHSKDISIAFWFKPYYQGEDWSNVLSICTETDDLSDTQLFRFELTTGQEYKWFNNDHTLTTSGFGALNPGTASHGSFCHVVLTASIRGKNITLRAYKNGQLYDEYSSTTVHSKTLHFIGPTVIGNSDSTYAIYGLSDVRVYDHILSIKEINDIRKCMFVHYPFEYDYDHLTDTAGMDMHPIRGSYSVSSNSVRGVYCAQFNNGDYVTVPSAAKLAQNFTWCVWAYMDNWSELPTTARILSCSEGYKGYSVYSNGTHLVWELGDSSAYANLGNGLEATKIANLHGWNLLCGSLNGKIYSAYLNGVKIESYTLSSTFSYDSNIPLIIGAEADSATTVESGSHFIGKLDDFRFYATTLSDKDIKDLYSCKATIDNRCSLDINLVNEISDNTPVINNNSQVCAAHIVENNYLTAADGSKFLRIFFHDLTYFKDCFPTVAESEYYIGGNCFSRLRDLKGDTFKNSAGEYEFILRYNNDSSLENRWKQKICPFSYTDDSSSSDIGYQTVGALNMYKYWGNTDGSTLPEDGMGLGLCTTGICLLDCQPTHGYWHGGLGQTEPYHEGVPAPDGNVYKFVELFVRIDNTLFDAASAVTNTTIYMNEFREV